jgi:hypothetical protein
MRCTTCGKWFQSANAKEVTCPDCLQKARKEKLAAKATQQSSTPRPGQASSSKPIPPPPPKPKEAIRGTSHWIDAVEDIKVSRPEQPKSKISSPPIPKDMKSGTTTERPGNRGPGSSREGSLRGPGTYRSDGPGISGGSGQRPRQPMTGGFGRDPQQGFGSDRRSDGKKGGKPTKAKAPKPPTPPKPKREKIPPPAPFTPTPEQIAQVETRYLELAVPTEFDGIRTQIAQELGIPKKAVKKIVKDLRERQGVPSWWELQTYKGSSEELEKIREVYIPYLPLPPIGVHKTFAEELSLNPGDVYQAIKAIRLDMNLPQYNDPTLHGLEPIIGEKKHPATSEEGANESQVENSETSVLETRSEAGKVEVTSAETPVEPVEIASSLAGDDSNSQE